MSASSKKWIWGVGVVVLVAGAAWVWSGGFSDARQGLVDGYEENQAQHQK